MLQERRQSLRVRAYRPIRLHRPSTPEVVETLTKDLALGGVRCISATLFPVATEFNVELMLSSGDEPLTVRGRAVWFRTIPESEQFDIGIVFHELSPQNKRRLSGYLDHLTHQSASTLV